MNANEKALTLMSLCEFLSCHSLLTSEFTDSMEGTGEGLYTYYETLVSVNFPTNYKITRPHCLLYKYIIDCLNTLSKYTRIS